MTNPFGALRDKIVLKLYLLQTISLLGEAFTWVGIALLAFSLEAIIQQPFYLQH